MNMTEEEAEDAIAEFTMLSIVHDGLMAQAQAAFVLGIPTNQMGTYVSRGRFTTFDILGTKMIPMPEVAAMRFWMTNVAATAKRGRGCKAPTGPELVKMGWGDMAEIFDTPAQP
jgi:hypothetical protein